MTQKDIDPADNSKPEDIIMIYCCVCAKMIAKRIENSMTMSSWKTLFSKRKTFTRMDTNGTASYDGPTMLQILVSGVNPLTRLGVSDLKTLICLTKFVHYQYNFVDMCDSIMSNYELIKERGGHHDDIVLDLSDSLLSGKNDVFNHFIERSKDNWEVVVYQTYDNLVNQSVTMYNNMIKKGHWKQFEAKEATIVALTN